MNVTQQVFKFRQNGVEMYGSALFLTNITCYYSTPPFCINLNLNACYLCNIHWIPIIKSKNSYSYISFKKI